MAVQSRAGYTAEKEDSEREQAREQNYNRRRQNKGEGERESRSEDMRKSIRKIKLNYNSRSFVDIYFQVI